MAVYVDDMRARVGWLVFSHMIADSDDELLRIADLIGVARRWHPYPGTYKNHFDICQTKRAIAIAIAIAIANGAQQVSQRGLGAIIRARRLQSLAAA